MLKLLIIIGKEKSSGNNIVFQEYLAKYLSNSFDVDIDVLTFSSKSLAYRAIIIVKHTLKLLPRVNNYDIIFSTSFLTVALLAFIKKLAHKKFKPALITIDIGTLRIKDFFARILYHVLDLDKIICFSRIQKRKLIQVVRVSENRVMFVHLGLQKDLIEFRKITIKKYIFSAGRYGRDFETLISAIEDLRLPTVLVVGKDPFRDKSLWKIPSLPNVTIYYEIPYEDYLSLLRSSTLVVLPLKYTQYPIGQTVLLDAMANGKAIIVSSVPAILDYIAGNFKDVVLVKPHNIKELRKRIEYLIGNPKYIIKLRHISRQRFNRKFTSLEMAKRIKGVLEREMS